MPSLSFPIKLCVIFKLLVNHVEVGEVLGQFKAVRKVNVNFFTRAFFFFIAFFFYIWLLFNFLFKLNTFLALMGFPFLDGVKILWLEILTGVNEVRGIFELL